MNEFRLDPESLSFTLVTGKSTACKACRDKDTALLSLPFGRGMARIFQVKDDIQPSKYELRGGLFKLSEADGYEEVIVDNENHSDAFKDYSTEDVEKLLSVLADRVKELRPEGDSRPEPYKVGENTIITRGAKEHGYFDLLMLRIPKKERAQCFECESLKNTGGREIYKNENFTVYVPFTPRNGFDLVLAPNKHMAFASCDPVMLFDVASMVKKVLGVTDKKLTWSIIERGDGHFKIRFVEGDVEPYTMLGISRIDINPEMMAKGIRESKKI